MYFRQLLSVIGMAALASCGGGSTDVTPPAPTLASVSLDPTSASLHPGETRTFTASPRTSAGAAFSAATVMWTSTDTRIATVSSAGVVTAVSAGQTTITATATSGTTTVSTTAIVTVTPVPTASVSVSLASASLRVGSTTQATATNRDANGIALSDRVATWTSSNPAVATVSATGLVTGVSAGTATITATSEGQSGTATVTVTAAPVATVSVTLAASTLTVNGSTQATAVTTDAAGAVLTDRAVTWSSSNTAVATVSSTGVVTGVSAGTATITAASEGKSGSATVTVSAVAPATVTVSLAAPSIIVGATTQATAVVRGADGAVLAGRTVTWSSSNTTVATVSSTGLVTGVSAGTVTITATSSGVSGSATLTVTAAPAPSPGCAPANATTVALGGVLPGLTGSSTCISGGTAGAEFALVAFYGNPDSSSIASVTVHSTGGATGVASSSSIVPVSPRLSQHARQTAFDRRLREMSRRELSPRIPGARAYARQRASFNTIPANPAIGSTFTLNANGNSACTNPINVTARVAAVSNTAIVVADVGNPAGGFTDAEYATFATMFDTLISPIDVANFGAPSDVDGNGKTLIFFTKEVNRLTPQGGLGGGGFIGGFFFERDLFPTVSTPTLQGCASSNFAEIYYSLVPDPNGTINQNVQTKAGVQSSTPGTLAHEFQHLINAGRRLYVNNANGFEDVWLNEGLSHIAEELLYYRVAGTAPRQNIGIAEIRRSQASVNAFNSYQGDNTGRYEVFLGMPSGTSVYAGNDELQTRGATWNLLRYLADHRGAADNDTWQLLVNSKTSGQRNIAGVFGTTYLTQIRDWATSVFADDLPGQSDVRFSQPSWNYRDIFPQLTSSGGQKLGNYPLKVLPLSDAAPVTTSIDAGGAAYIRFRVPAGGSVSVDWTVTGAPIPSQMQFTLVRSK